MPLHDTYSWETYVENFKLKKYDSFYFFYCLCIIYAYGPMVLNDLNFMGKWERSVRNAWKDSIKWLCCHDKNVKYYFYMNKKNLHIC